MLVCSSKAGMLEILTKTKINGRMSALLIAQFIDVFVFDSLVVFLSCHLKAAGEKAQMTLRVSVSQWFLRRRPWRIRGIAFWCALHLELCRILWYHLHWHLPGVRPWNSRETVPPGMSVHTCAPGCVCLCVIEYAHCTQPAQGEDPFSHQIFTSNHRLPAAIMHTHCRVIGARCIRIKQRPIKSLSSRFLGIISQVYVAHSQVLLPHAYTWIRQIPTWVKAGRVAKLSVKNRFPGVDWLRNMWPARTLPE